MNTLIVYDNEGFVFYTAQGEVKEPVGVPSIRVDLEEGEYVPEVDVSKEPHMAVIKQYPKTAQQLQQEEIDTLKKKYNDLVLSLVEGGTI